MPMSPLTLDQINAYKSAIPSATENEPMAKHTSFRIGGPARLYVVATSSDALIEAVAAARRLAVPWYVFGGGSNLLVADEGFEGVMIQAANRGFTIDGERVILESGVVTIFAARKIVEAGLEGFEWASGIPGTIGGAIYGDAGCFGGEMRDHVVSVDAWRLRDGKRVTLSKEECAFGYRDSLFKHEPHLILGCELRLRKAADPVASRARFEEVMKTRVEKQPLDQSSCGCIFKNYEFKDERELAILRRQADPVPEGMLKNHVLASGWLVDQVGLRGTAVGNIAISEKHGNFFVNKGQARAQDVVQLISLAKMKVRDELGIELQEEVQYVGF